MYEGCSVNLQMKRMILEGEKEDDTVYRCSVIQYFPEEEKIYLLLLDDATLPEISLDAVYRCSIFREDELLKCSGMITERFIDKRGHVLIFLLENGFYKNNLN